MREPSRIWWRTTSLFPCRETSSAATAWVILVPFSIDRIGQVRGPWLFFLSELEEDFILFEVGNGFLGKLQAWVQVSSGQFSISSFNSLKLLMQFHYLLISMATNVNGSVFSFDRSAPLILECSFCFYNIFFLLFEDYTVKHPVYINLETKWRINFQFLMTQTIFMFFKLELLVACVL